MASPDMVRVAAVPGVYAQVPGHVATHGGRIAYVGRRVDHDAVKASSKTRADGAVVITDFEAAYPPDAEHNSVFTREGHGPEVLNALRKMMRDGDVAPGDIATAQWAGISPAPAAIAPRQPTRSRRAEGTEGTSQ